MKIKINYFIYLFNMTFRFKKLIVYPNLNELLYEYQNELNHTCNP